MSISSTCLAYIPQHNRDSPQLALHLIIFLLALTALLGLFNLPKALARLSTSSDWAQGYLLRSIRLPCESYPSKSPGRHRLERLSGLDSTPTAYPIHVPAYPASLTGAARILGLRVSPGLFLGRFIILAGYAGIISYACLYRSNLVTDPDRTGFIAISQLPFVFVLAMKSNLFGWIVGTTVQKLHYLHRFAGRLVMIMASIHSFSYIYLYTIDGTLSERVRQPHMAWGVVALACINVLAFCSMGWFRQRVYALFYASHVVSFCLLIPSLYFHNPSMMPFILAAAAAYALDHVLKLLKTRIAIATLTVVPELSLTSVEIPSINVGWRAGQHVRLRVLSAGMGALAWAEAHPFTIASVGRAEQGLVLLCKKTGDWTGRLYELAKAAEYADEKGAEERRVRVVVQGPYGGPGYTVFASYSAAVFVVGGSGISFALAAVEDLLQKDSIGASSVKAIELVWIVRDASSFLPFSSQFNSMAQRSTHTALRISVHYTRAPRAGTPPPPPSCVPGRPRLDKVLDAVLSRVVSLGAGRKDERPITGVLVGVCGPPALRDDVLSVVGGVEPERRARVGGIEVYEEVFGW